MLLGFCLRRCTEASEASVICTLEVRAPQANKKKTSTNKSRAKQAQAQAKDKCRRRQIQAPQAAKPNTRRFGAQKSTGQCGEKLSRAFAKASALARGSTSCQKMRACVYRQTPSAQTVRGLRRKATGRRSSCCRRHMLPAARRQRAARRRSQNFFWGGPAWGVPEGHQGACWASKLPPVFKAGK